MHRYFGVFVVVLAFACGNMGNSTGGNGGNGGTGGNGGSGGGGGGGGGGAGSGGAGGGGAGGVEPDYASGSRIKARVMSTADGAKAFAGFYDTTLSTSCSFTRAADDTLRCLPSTSSYVSTFYADSGCSTPLAYNASGCAGTYASRYETTTSCVDVGYNSTTTRTHVHMLGAAYNGTVWAGTPASCSMTTPSYPVYSVGSEVAASIFAAGSVDNAP